MADNLERIIVLEDLYYDDSSQDIIFAEQNEDRSEKDLRPDAYTYGNFHPVCIGQLYGQPYQERYLVLRKLGYGMYSTVWLVVDVHTERHWAMKVLSAECYGRENDNNIFEIDILKRFGEYRDCHPGSQYVSHLHDSFGVSGPYGYSACLIFSVMADTLERFGDCPFFEYQNIPSNVVKRFVKQLLLALDYAHTLGVIHTGLFFIIFL
jgi:serine/threonine-protein kinase SRPK3